MPAIRFKPVCVKKTSPSQHEANGTSWRPCVSPKCRSRSADRLRLVGRSAAVSLSRASSARNRCPRRESESFGGPLAGSGHSRREGRNRRPPGPRPWRAPALPQRPAPRRIGGGHGDEGQGVPWPSVIASLAETTASIAFQFGDGRSRCDEVIVFRGESKTPPGTLSWTAFWKSELAVRTQPGGTGPALLEGVHHQLVQA